MCKETMACISNKIASHQKQKYCCTGIYTLNSYPCEQFLAIRKMPFIITSSNADYSGMPS
jgi:hypothetical protein